MKKRAIVWFRQDLRLHDNEAIEQAIRLADEILYVYIFDERVFLGNTKFGFPKTNSIRANFIKESIDDLKQSLNTNGAQLQLFLGKPEEIIFELAKKYKTSWVFCNRERTFEELNVQDKLEKNLWSIGQEIIYSRGKLLYHTQDLPFPIAHAPDSFTTFRKEVEKIVSIREPIPQPINYKPLEIAEYQEFDYQLLNLSQNNYSTFKGGESNGILKLKEILLEISKLGSKQFNQVENIGDFYSKLSPWLAQGCISPKLIYKELKDFESEFGSNDITYQFFIKLLWRDYYRLIGKKYEQKIFLNTKIFSNNSKIGKIDFVVFEKWQSGKTGIPIIDAIMSELNQTGYINKKCREIVSSFLIFELEINWQMGAEYFESQLIDYDVCSNWCNWNFIAHHPKEYHLNVFRQAKSIDSEGKYVKLWLENFDNVPIEKIQTPFELSKEEIKKYNINLDKIYLNPIIKINN